MDKSNITMDSKLTKEVGGVLVIAATILTVVSLVSYNQVDIGDACEGCDAVAMQNLAGPVGAYLSAFLIHLVGSAAWAVPVILLAVGVIMFREDSLKQAVPLIIGGIIFIVSATILLNISYEVDPQYSALPAGGLMGNVLATKIFVRVLARPGTGILGITLFFLSALVATKLSVLEFLSKAKSGIGEFVAILAERFSAICSRLGFMQGQLKRRMEQAKATPEIMAEVPTVPVEAGVAADLPQSQNAASGKAEEPQIVKQKQQATSGAENEFQAKQANLLLGDAEFELPPISFLNKPLPVQRDKSDKELLANSKILTMKLADFGIDGRVTMVLPGPVITLYEFEPAAGIKVSRIVNLADDLAMGLRALSVRILAPVPGKAVVGIEVPNHRVEPVSLRSVLESPEYKEKEMALPMALGKDTSGLPVVVDLATTPHLLVAGSTGSGKSVGLNGMIMSILYHSTPDEVNFIMIDPKMLELSVYDGIPHLISPVVTNPKKAASAIKWAVEEMERRYQLLAEMGFRNIQTYNVWVREFLREKAEEDAKEAARPKPPEQEVDPQVMEFDGEGPIEEEEPEPEPEPPKPLPYIVIVIDELADLMLVASKEVEDSLARLAQMARAAGLHLIVATQRPSVDVLTGLIKANFPARISYQVRSRVDSRTILDSMGAEKLLGKGDMLFLSPGTSILQRLHGPFVTDEEVKKTAQFLKKQGRPTYNKEILTKDFNDMPDILSGGGSGSGDDDDEYFEKAVEIISTTRQASISMVQRRLRIGYNRAARIIETMEARGMVGPSDGAKPREVLIPEIPEDDGV